MDLSVRKLDDKGGRDVESMERPRPTSRNQLCNTCKTVRISQLKLLPWPNEHRHIERYADLVASAECCLMCRLMATGLRRSYAWRKSNFGDPLILDKDLDDSLGTKYGVFVPPTQVGLYRLPLQGISVQAAHVSENQANFDIDLYAFPGMHIPLADW